MTERRRHHHRQMGGAAESRPSSVQARCRGGTSGGPTTDAVGETLKKYGSRTRPAPPGLRGLTPQWARDRLCLPRKNYEAMREMASGAEVVNRIHAKYVFYVSRSTLRIVTVQAMFDQFPSQLERGDIERPCARAIVTSPLPRQSRCHLGCYSSSYWLYLARWQISWISIEQ